MRISNGLAVTNPDSTYGMNTSAANNYGLGRSFLSNTEARGARAAKHAAPSWMWLAVILVFVWLVSR